MTDQRRRSRKDATADREEVLRTALAIAARVGFDGTRMSVVAAEAGQSESFVYWHFRTKENLVAQAVEFGYHKRRERGQTWMSPEPGPGRLDALARNFAGPDGYELTEHEPWRLGLMLSMERRESAAEQKFVEMRDETVQRVHRWWTGSLDASRIVDLAAAAEFLTHLTLAAHDGHFLSRARRSSDAHSPVLLAHAIHAVALELESGAVPPRADSRPTLEPNVHPEATSVKQSLLRAAAKEVSALGADAASVARICEAAGVPPTSLYWWFEDRSSLIAEAITDVFNNWRRVVPPPIEIEGDSVDEIVAEFLRRVMTGMMREPDMPRILNMESLHHDRSTMEAHAHLQTMRVSSHTDLTTVLQRVLPTDHSGISAEGLADFVVSLADGLFIASQVDHRYLALDEMVPALVSMVRAAVAVDLTSG